MPNSCRVRAAALPIPEGGLCCGITPDMRSAVRVLALCLVFGVLFSTGCYQVPVTGRRAMSAVDDKAVKQQSIAQFNEMKKRYPISKNRQQMEMVRRVGERIARVVFWDLPDAEWEFVLFEVPQQINAFAMPGGKVGVFSGLFRVAKNEDQLASVLAHEIAHVTAKHTHERLTQAMLVQGGGLAAGALVTAQTGNIYAGSSALQGTQLIGGIGVTAFDRGKEKEADHIGLIYMARAGYNPEEAVKVFENLEAENAGRPAPGGWISTHPSYPERMIQMLDLMPKAMESYRNSGAKPAAAAVIR